MAAGDQTISLLNNIVSEMLLKVDKSDLSAVGGDTALLKEIHGLLDQFGVVVKDVLAPEILQSYFGGVDEATAAIAKAGLPVAATLAVSPEGLITKPFQKVVHVSAVTSIIDSSMMDMSAAINTAKQSANETIMQTLENVKTDLAEGLIKGDARKTIQQKVAKTFRDQGMTAFVTADGKNLPLNFYASTVARTKTRTATVAGSMNRYKDAESVNFIQIRGNGDSCEICSRFNEVVVSIGGKKYAGYLSEGDITLPPYHPNCRCSVHPWRLGDKTPEEKDAAKARGKEYKKNPLADRRTPAQKAAYEDEQRRRRIANAEVKQYMRWQTLLGAEAPKSIGAFRTMKRKNSPKFQSLQSMVHSQAGFGKTLQGADYKAKLPKLKNVQVAPVTAAPLVDVSVPEPPKPKPKPKAKSKTVKYTKESALEKYPYPTDENVPTPFEQIMDPVKWAKKQDKLAAAKPKVADDVDDIAAKLKAMGFDLPTPKAEPVTDVNGIKKLPPASVPESPEKLSSSKEQMSKMFKKGRQMESELLGHIRDSPLSGDRAKKLEVYAETREAWMDSSIGGYSSGLQNFVNKKYNLGLAMLTTESYGGNNYDLPGGFDDVLETQQKFFQNKLKAKGFTHVKVYRGVNVPSGEDVPDWFPTEFAEDGTTTYNDGPAARALTSWSFSKKAATGFTAGSRNTVIFEADIPVDQLFSAFGLGDESELVPVGAVRNVRFTEVSEGMTEVLAAAKKKKKKK